MTRTRWSTVEHAARHGEPAALALSPDTARRSLLRSLETRERVIRRRRARP